MLEIICYSPDHSLRLELGEVSPGYFIHLVQGYVRTMGDRLQILYTKQLRASPHCLNRRGLKFEVSYT